MVLDKRILATRAIRNLAKRWGLSCKHAHMAQRWQYPDRVD